MKFSSPVTCASVLLVFTVPAISAQFQIATPAKDYSFTISTAQPWTDTGVDLQAGERLQISASVGESCDPAGVSGSDSTGLPVVSAPAGALIARLQAQGVPVLVGSGQQLRVETPGHLFLGVNASGTPPCAGNFAVKVNVSVRGGARRACSWQLADACCFARCGAASSRSHRNAKAGAGHQVEAGQRRPGFSGRTIRHRCDCFRHLRRRLRPREMM